MFNNKNTIFLLAFFMLQVTGVLQAKEAIDFAGSRFSVGKGASVEIGESASITVSNIIIEADISGKGELILLSNKNAYIDANNHSIENLVIAAANKVELLSGLQIVNELTILKGKLHLNDFDLSLCPDAKLNNSSLLKIILNGSGTILQQSIGIPNAANTFTFSGSVQFDFSVLQAFTTANSSISCDNIFYYTLPFIPHRTNNVLVPPPKA